MGVDGLSSVSQEVATLLSLLGDGADVEGPHEVFRDVNTKKLSTLDDLHQGAFDAQWRVITTWPPDVNNHVFSLVDIQRELSHSNCVTITCIRTFLYSKSQKNQRFYLPTYMTSVS